MKYHYIPSLIALLCLSSCTHISPEEVIGAGTGGLAGGFLGSAIGGKWGAGIGAGAGALVGSWLGRSWGEANRRAALEAVQRSSESGQTQVWRTENGHGEVRPRRASYNQQYQCNARECEVLGTVDGRPVRVISMVYQHPDGTWRTEPPRDR